MEVNQNPGATTLCLNRKVADYKIKKNIIINNSNLMSILKF